MTEIHGICPARFAGVRDAFARNFEAGFDVGASVALSLDGELVLDLFGGHVDAARTKPWQRDTLVNVYSTTKTMTALCALVLADRGELDLDAKVARYWPEFAAAGKRDVLVRHLLGHTSGLSGWEQPVLQDDLYDWDKMTSLLAAQAPWWEPGSASGYHALTQGYLVGEVVRRVTGSSLGAFFAKEVAGVVDADFHIGLAPEHDARVARVIPPITSPSALGAPGSVVARTFGNPALSAEASWTEPWRRAEIPAANGHGNARSIAIAQSILACPGDVGGRRLLSARGADAVFSEQARGVDLVLGAPLRIGMGYGLNGAELPIGPNPRTCFWGGWGGSLCVVDLDTRMSFAYAMNRMGEGTLGDTRGLSLLLAVYAGLEANRP